MEGACMQEGSGWGVSFGALSRGENPLRRWECREEPMVDLDCASEAEAAALYEEVDLFAVARFAMGLSFGARLQACGAYKEVVGPDDVAAHSELAVVGSPWDEPGPAVVAEGLRYGVSSVCAAGPARELAEVADTLDGRTAAPGQEPPEGSVPVGDSRGGVAFARLLPDPEGSCRAGWRSVALALARGAGGAFRGPDVARAAEALGVPGHAPSGTWRALRALEAEGLVARTGGGAYVACAPPPRAAAPAGADPGGALRAARIARGWTQRKLAEEAGCTAHTVWSLENGRIDAARSACYPSLLRALAAD